MVFFINWNSQNVAIINLHDYNEKKIVVTISVGVLVGAVGRGVAVVALRAAGAGRGPRRAVRRWWQARGPHALPPAVQAEALLARHAGRQRRPRREHATALHARWEHSSIIRPQWRHQTHVHINGFMVQ